MRAPTNFPQNLPSVLELETASLLAWPALEEIRDGAWVGRLANGYSRRSNSLQSIDPSDEDNIDARLEAMRARFKASGVPFQFRVTPLAGPAVQAALRAQGWTESDHNHVMAMPLRKVMRPVAATTQGFVPTDPEWIAIQTRLAGTEKSADALRGILEKLTVPARGVIAYGEDLRPLAAALVVNSNSIALFLNVVVDENYRGMGFGRAIMHAGLNWAAQNGALFAALQVSAENATAIGLYTTLGFTRQYDYVYWVDAP